MRFNSKILINLFILFFSFETLEIKAHNNINGGCKDYCYSLFNNRGNENNINNLDYTFSSSARKCKKT